MTMDTSLHSRPKQFLPRQAERRKPVVMRGKPLIGGLGLVINERRSRRERRRQPWTRPPEALCALLQRKGTDRQGRSFLPGLQAGPGKVRGAAVPGPASQSAAARLLQLGSWLKRRLKSPWQG